MKKVKLFCNCCGYGNELGQDFVKESKKLPGVDNAYECRACGEWMVVGENGKLRGATLGESIKIGLARKVEANLKKAGYKYAGLTGEDCIAVLKDDKACEAVAQDIAAHAYGAAEQILEQRAKDAAKNA